MHRPTRQLANLKAKLERKLATSSASGKKAKRWQRWIKEYEALSKDAAAKSAD